MSYSNSRTWPLLFAAVLTTVALALFASACGGEEDDAVKGTSGDAAATFGQVPSPDKAAPAGSKVFVGHDKANKVSVGLIVFSDNKAAAYACDGDATWSWYEGTTSGNDLTLKSATGATLTAKINGASVTGTAPGSADFTLEAAKDRAGLYRTSASKGADSETAGWVIENDGALRGGIGATVAGKKLTAGAIFIPTQLADVQALPEFPAVKLLAPNFPTLPPNLTVFSAPGGVCGRLYNAILDSGPSTEPANTNSTVNRARRGLMGLIGCPQNQFFTN